jgi:hypothetical protein
MSNSFFAYLQQLELSAFFSGYPLIYFIVVVIAGSKPPYNNFRNKIVSHLPFAYALVGTLYLGLQLRNLYPNYSFENIRLSIQLPWLIGWALLSLLFWIPALGKKTWISLLHSLIFFLILVKDFVMQISRSSGDKDMVRNDMKLYTSSLLINLTAIAFILLVSFMFTYFKKRSDS